MIVGPQVRSRRLDDLSKAFFACLTAVWMVKAGSALGLRTFVGLRDDTAMVYLNSHRSHGLERCSFHRDETHASRFRKVSGFERCRTASLSLVGFVTYIPEGRVGLTANRTEWMWDLTPPSTAMKYRMLPSLMREVRWAEKPLQRHWSDRTKACIIVTGPS